MLKRFLSIMGLVLVTTFAGQAQTVQDVFNPTVPVTWLGIDYSHSKIVGPISKFGGSTPVTAADLHDRYYGEWNQLVLSEPQKYDIAKMIARKGVVNDISMVTALNAASSLDSLEVAATPYYTPEQIQSFISHYPTTNKSGIGLVFLTECLNKSYGGAYYHVVFFKMDTKEILFQERMLGISSGAGIRNYWGGSHYNIIEYVRDERWSKWKKRYAAPK